jgi:3-hydroxyisobutyrate dehydrogenase
MQKETIGFIGLGNMGYPMAGHLATGFTILAYDAVAATTERFAREFSTRRPERLADLAPCTVVMTMLPTSAVVREVLTGGGEASLANSLKPGSLLIDTTSSVPSATVAMGELLARRGIAMIDAPVSGGRKGAIAADLVFMMGGNDDAAIARAKPILEVLGPRQYRTGALGCGNVMKAMNNYVSGAAFVATCEALVIGRQYGLDPQVMVDILNVSTGRNFSTENSMDRIVNRTFDGTFKLGLFTKDLKMAAEMADARGVTAPLSHLVHDRMEEARARIGGDGDHTTAYTYWEKQIAEPPRG